MVDLSQGGMPCSLTASVGMYAFGGTDSFVELSKSLDAGMVPIVSYWTSPKLRWLDGPDVQGSRPCHQEEPLQCAETAKVYGFSVSNYTGFLHKSTMHLEPTTP